MSNDILNKSLLQHNSCYGCGHENINGLRIEIIKDPGNTDTLLAEFNAKEYMQGTPGLVHSGCIFTAMECPATWTPVAFVSHINAIWRTQSARVEYLGTTYIDQPLLLSAHITQADPSNNPVMVHVNAKNSAGEPVTKADFQLIPYSESEYIESTGIEPLPQNWRDFLDR